jgi:hypothetical protein
VAAPTAVLARLRRGIGAEPGEGCAVLPTPRGAPPAAGRGIARETAMDEWSSARLCDVANLILGMVVFFSPWLFGLPAGVQWDTASIVGIFIAVLSIAALAAFAVWEEWLNLVAGLALIVSPWLFGFQDSDAMTINVVIGAIVALLAACEVWLAQDLKSRLRSRANTSH